MLMQYFGFRSGQIGFTLSGWRVVAALTVFLAVVAGVIIFALGLMIVLAPILLLGSVGYYLLSGTRLPVSAQRLASQNVIEGEFWEANQHSLEKADRIPMIDGNS